MEIQTKVKAMEIQTKVTRIGKRWHCRIFNSNKVLDEMACDSRLDIGFCFRYMLRWHDKWAELVRWLVLPDIEERIMLYLVEFGIITN